MQRSFPAPRPGGHGQEKVTREAETHRQKGGEAGRGRDI